MKLLKGKLHIRESIGLPKEIFEKSGFKAGDNVKIMITKYGILIMPEKYDLVDLMSGLSPVRKRYDETEYYELIFPTMYTIIGIISAEEHHKDENAP